MTTQTITTIKDGTIAIPKEFRSGWKDADVYVRISQDTVILKNVYQEGKMFDDEMVTKLKKLGKRIKKKDIDEAVAWARSVTYPK